MVMNSTTKGPSVIEEAFGNLASKRQASLDRARHMAALTKPHVMPPLSFDSAGVGKDSDNYDLPRRYQSTGSRGVTAMAGKMLLALWPPGVQWFKFEPSPALKYAAVAAMRGEYDLAMAQLENLLFAWSLVIQANLDSSSLESDGYQRGNRFRTAKRESLEQLIVTGDTLEYMDDDFRIRVFRRDMYVTQRDSCKSVLYHITRESIDCRSLSEEVCYKAHLHDDVLSNKDPAKRLVDIYTRVEWQPRSKTWLIEQECNGHVINESEEPVTPYFCTAYNLISGEHYGRGFIEDIEGDLNSHNDLRGRLLDWAAACSKKHPVLDQNSTLRPQDLEKPAGEVLIGRVTGGQVQDMAWTGVDKLADFNVVANVDDRISADLHRSMLMESDIQPQKERVTAAQIQRIASELESSLGGLYAPIAESQQEPVLRRVRHVLQKRGELPTLKDKSLVKARALTGIEAISRELSADRLLRFVQIIASLPEGIRYLRQDVLANLLMRYSGIYENGLVKSAADVQQEDQNAIQQQIALAAGQKAVDTAGNVVENQLNPKLTAGAA